MGYRGFVEQRAQAAVRRDEGATVAQIAGELGVARATVSGWLRDRPAGPASAGSGRAHPQHLARLAEIERFQVDGRERIGVLSARDLLIAGTALYAGEGAKTDGVVKFANCDARMIYFFVTWLRRFFEIDETRLRVRLYLHVGLDLDVAVDYWSRLTAIPIAQFGKPYRAVADASLRTPKHLLGCPAVAYASAPTHRAIMGLVDALLSSPVGLPG